MEKTKKQMLIGGGFLATLVVGGALAFMSFQNSNSTLAAEIDPITQLLGGSIEGEEADTKKLKADFYGSSDSTAHYDIAKYNGVVPTEVQACMNEDNLGVSANLGFVYANLDNNGLATLLERKFNGCTPGQVNQYVSGNTITDDTDEEGDVVTAIDCLNSINGFVGDLSKEWGPVLGHARSTGDNAEKQIHWDWNSETRKYLFYTFPGDEEFWYCYLKTISPYTNTAGIEKSGDTFPHLFKTGNFTDDNPAEGENTLYYGSVGETYPLDASIEESTWQTVESTNEGILNQSARDYLESIDVLTNGEADKPLRLLATNYTNKDVQEGVTADLDVITLTLGTEEYPVYGSYIEGEKMTGLYRRDYKENDWGTAARYTDLCLFEDIDFHHENYKPVTKCEDVEMADFEFSLQYSEALPTCGGFDSSSFDNCNFE